MRALLLLLCVTSPMAAAQSDLPPPPPPPPPPAVVPSAELIPPPPVPPTPPEMRAAVEQAPRLNRFTFSPMSVFLLSVAFEYERGLTDRMSLFVGPQIWLIGLIAPTLFASLQVPPLYGAYVDTGMRFFPIGSHRAPKGYWVSPVLRLGLMAGGAWLVPTVEVLGTTGYTIVTDGGFTASFGGGLGAGYALLATGSMGFAVDFDLHVNLGVAF